VQEGKEQEDFQTVLKADGETETMQENIQIGVNWVKKTSDFSFSQKKKFLQ
jgi:hypothetical protein